MAANLSLGTRRALVLYVGAVVGPTLVVLAAGVAAVRRQADAVDMLQSTTRSLQQQRIVDEVERRALGLAGAALQDATLDTLIALPVDAPPERLDAVRRALAHLPPRHPVVREVFLLDAGTLVFPRVDPPLPGPDTAGVLDDSSVGTSAVGRHLTIARQADARGDYAEAADRYARVAAQATTAGARAAALSASARCALAAGQRERAVAAYRSVVDQDAGTYTAAGRPHALAAAVELARLDALTPAIRHRIVADIGAGRWTMPAGQLAHVRTQLGLQADAASANRLASLLAVAAVRDRLEPMADPGASAVHGETMELPGGVVDVVYRTLPGTTRTVGVLVEATWVERDLMPRVAAEIAPGSQVVVVDHTAVAATPFRTMLRGARLGLVDQPSGWLPRDLLAFASSIAAVLGLLVLGVVLLVRDVARETRLNQVRADLVSGVSHELSAPVTVIRACAETLESADDAAADVRRQFTRAIVEETDRLQRLVGDVVAFSKIQQGQRAYRLVPGSLTEVVTAAVDRFRRYAGLHGFELSTSMDAEVPRFDLDADAVEQAVLNLLDNAVKYGGDGKRVEVALRRVGREAFVEVRDEGAGIPHERQARLFDRYERGIHADRGGYGLGLYLVRHVMEGHRGQVEVESEPGHGSLFRLRFVLSGAADAENSAG